MDHTLETGRLRLRMFRNDDIDAYHAMCSDPEVMQFMADGKPLTRLEAWRQMAAILGHWQLRGYGSWVLEEKSSGRLIGRAGFINPETWPALEIGWALARESWGRGYATEAARAVLDYGRARLGIARVISLIHPQNTRSVGVAERLGGRRDTEIEFFGKTVDVYVYDVPPQQGHFLPAGSA